MNGYYAIAIDGPSGAGKSSMAKELAKRFNFIYVDTGAIYRTLGLAALRENIDRKSGEECMKLLPTLEISMGYNDAGEQRMYLNGEDVSGEIRQPEVSVAASDVSSHGDVRKFLLEMQRKMARENNVIMDGRDIGTVVLPDAELKIFLTADDTARADRRLRELEAKGVETSFEDVLKDIRYRDEQDSTRAAAPLKKAEDAVLVDSSELDFNATLDLLCSIVLERLFISEEK
ncbi:MAG: (d)CMP kinase [Eubacteriales bacterium]|nr:(d)CMP kinase [Eubacteriales bacterium]